MSFTSVTEPQPSLAWQFENSNVDYVSSLSPSYSTVSGALTSLPTFVSGKYNQAIRLAQTAANSGANTYVLWSLAASPISIDTTGITIACWVNWTTLPGSFISMYDSFSNVLGIYMNSTQTYTGRGFSGTQALTNATSNTSTNSTGVWYHVALTYNSTSVILYKNGVGTTPVATGAPGVTITGLRIGSQANNINPTYVGYACADCTIDDLRIYNTALTAAQVQSVYSSQGAPAPGPVMPQPQYAWDFNGTTTPYIGSATGTTTGTATYNSGGKYGQSLIMNGSSYVKYSKTLGYNLGTGGATFAMWFKLLAIPVGTNFWIFGASGTSYSDRIYILVGTTGYIGWTFIDNTLAGKVLNSPSALVVGAWTHLTFTLFNGTMTMYVNGAQVSTRSDAPMSGVVLDTQFALAALAGGSGDNINAEYDDFRIFDRALTSIQVNDIYNQQGVPGRGAMNSYSLPTLPGYTYIPAKSLPSSFTLIQTATSNAWTYGSGQLTDGGANPVLTLVADAPTDLYSAVNPGIWCRLGRQGGANEYVRHASFVMFLNGYAANNFDFAWAFFLKNGTANQVKVWNPYPGNGVGNWVQSGIHTAGRIAISTTDPLQAHIYTISAAPAPSTSMSGAPLFNQLSPAATSSAVGAFSLRAVNGVSTRAVNVRNGTTSATQDFYADERGNLLTAPVTGTTLQNWLGGATGYVTTWYDQSGRGNHAIQNTAANQPIIQRATKGPGYACLFNGTTNFLTGMSYTVLNATNFSFNIVERRTGSSSGGTASNDLTLLSCGNFGATGKLLYLIYRNNTNSLFGSWSPELYSTVTAYNSSTEPIRYTSATASSTSGRRVYIYNDPLGNPISASDATQTSLMSMTSGNFQIGYYTFGSSTSYYKGEIYELLVFTQSLYDLDGTTSINQIYQNQLGAYGT